MSGQHARCSASAADRFMACPGSVVLGELAPPEEDSEYAAEGTAAHTLAATCLLDGTDAYMHSGGTLDGFPINGDMVEAVQVYLDHVRGARGEEDELYVEHSIDSAVDDPAFGGTSDAVISGPGGVSIIDYKHGAGIPVEVEDNSQLRYYAFGVLRSLNFTREDKVPVNLAIVQPRAHHSQGPVREQVTDAAEIIAWGEDELLPAIEQAVSGVEEFNSGDHCRWCPARLLCPEVRKSFDEYAEANVSDIPELSEEQLAETYAKVKAAEFYIKAIKAEAVKRALAGAALPGTKLINGRASRNWKAGHETALIEAFGDDAFTEPGLRSPAQVEKLPGGKDFATEWAFKEPGRPVLVDAKAKGEPYVVDGSGFTNIPQSDN